jgi:quinol---cytochrome-c reductase cytochrome c subunit
MSQMPKAVCRALFSFLLFAPQTALAQQPATGPAEGAVVYAMHCIKCHGPDGGGVAAIISIAGPSLRAEHDRDDVVKMVINGKPPMPSFKPVLSSAQINAVADYVTTQLADIPLAPGDLGEGGKLFRIYCSTCHGAPGRGGAVTFAGTNAPSLADKNAATLAGTIRWGPGPMPSFPESVLSDQQLDSIVTYIQFLQHPPHPGGSPLGYFGPVAEGFVGWLAAFALVGAAMWIERKGKG